MSLRREQINVAPGQSYPFHVLATKYTYDGNPYQKSSDAFTLVLTHSLGVHMETWEVTADRLFMLSASANSRVKICEMFSIESPNHGRSAVVNAEEIAKHPLNDWTREYSRAVQRFLTWLSAEKRVNLTARNLIGISHSFGAPALFIAAEAVPTINFKAMITFEPGITSKDSPHRHRSNNAAIAWAWLRPDVWRSRKAAKKELAASAMYSTWDPRVFDLFIEHGLIDHPASKHKAPFTFPGVITALSGNITLYRISCESSVIDTNLSLKLSFHSDDLVVDEITSYAAATQRMPVHVVWGSIHELANQELKDFMSDAKGSRTPESVSYIQGASHMVIQQKPDKAAEVMHSLLLIESRRMCAGFNINAVCNTPNIWSPYLYSNPPRYVDAFSVNLVASVLAILFATATMLYLKRQNAKLDKGLDLRANAPTAQQQAAGFRYII
ncbi:Alpha/beta hydrolase family-domain-containing protein [Mycena leptocephala]|nr:Alpha/beta hydrolase family-domain-containing protein [Mycena leptocephala]